MRLALLAVWLALPLTPQEPHVHGGFAACVAAADWLTQERLVRAQAVQEWNEFMRGHDCTLTVDGAAYEIRPSETPGTVLIRRRAVEKQEPDPWRFVSIAALEAK